MILFYSLLIQHTREWLSGGAPPCQGGGRGFDPRLALSYIKEDISMRYPLFYIFEHNRARRFDLLVYRLGRCISVASTGRHAPSRTLLYHSYKESTNRINAACPSSVRLYTPAHSSTFTNTLLISSCRTSVIFSAVMS